MKRKEAARGLSSIFFSLLAWLLWLYCTYYTQKSVNKCITTTYCILMIFWCVCVPQTDLCDSYQWMMTTATSLSPSRTWKISFFYMPYFQVLYNWMGRKKVEHSGWVSYEHQDLEVKSQGKVIWTPLMPCQEGHPVFTPKHWPQTFNLIIMMRK